MTLNSIRNVVCARREARWASGIAATFGRQCGYATTLSDVGAEQFDKARAAVAFVFEHAGGRARES
jgi:hypothetical protein